MKLNNQFLRLHSHYGHTEETEVTLDELAAALDCTHRNAMIIVNKMAQHGWISWTSHRGRGRRSSLQFLVQPEEIAVQSVMQSINRKDFKRTFDQISIHARSSSLQDRLQGWLLTYFGHHSEIRSDKQIDTLRLPIREQLHTFDPLYMNLLAESFVSSHVFDGLARRMNNSNEILPNIAHAWDVDQARTRWTFFLRKEILFHNGKIMTAADVVYSLDRLIHSSRRTLYSFIFKQIRSVRAINPTTVIIDLEEPSELFLPFLCTSRAAIVPKDLDQIGEALFGTRPIGSGPFKVAQMNESICVLEVFTPYFQGRAHLDRVEIVHVPWGMKNDPADHLLPFHVMQGQAWDGEAVWSQIHSEASVRKFITCNTKKAGPLTDPTVRARILACLRDDSTASASSGDQGDQPNSIGTLQIATIPPYKQDAEAVAAGLEKHGYACHVVFISPEDFKGMIRLESDLILFSLLRDQDEQLRLFDLYLTIAEHVEPHTRVDIERLLHTVKQSPDAKEREQGLARIQDQLIQENQLHILYEKPVQTAYLPSVRGVTFNSQGWVDLRNIWFPSN
ncbi:peptide-binding protein [Paenibacillus baekrokdamisoli]|uniref:Peptide-binding protein n=1 Tax=Paenibacillus baekrokdamisoli TaxID=1712516 RepID=A0A3G9J5J9_9BACL|nr:ABC transporter substrate-binding protein [Paenibacillus baekrokdamisoli]MBB3068818.1 MarR-like DNA-binding transcriptional regulator SgrR of sgrS sRNA [Paenibacillus baekrokdamisoli]BBH23645.1 peptide-binding protein [Paenibacillus baekrokdamisoli]